MLCQWQQLFLQWLTDPEISYMVAKRTRDDIIIATGRSDHPNQVNNVLGFIYFWGALDVGASKINEMKMAAVYALAKLAKEPVLKLLMSFTKKKKLMFGRLYNSKTI